MERISLYVSWIARVMMSVVFVLNGLGIIDQQIPAREMIERGMPAALVPAAMFAGRSVEVVAGFALATGIFPDLAAFALFLFLVPATLVSHSFWLSTGTAAFQSQLINFSKNVAIWGGLLFIARSGNQPALSRLRSLKSLPALGKAERLQVCARGEYLADLIPRTGYCEAHHPRYSTNTPLRNGAGVRNTRTFTQEHR